MPEPGRSTSPSTRRRVVVAATTLLMGAAAAPLLSLPATLDSPRGRVATAEEDPSGPAAMVYTYDTSRPDRASIAPLVLDAREDVYRAVGTATERSTELDAGAPAWMQLAPDGGTVAVGSSRGNGNVAFVDLVSGDVSTISVDDVNSTLPSAWSVDGDYVWVRGRHVYEATRSGATTYDDWEWHGIDLASGDSEPLPELRKALTVAPLGDSGLLLVRHNQTHAEIVDIAGREVVGDPVELSGTVEAWAGSPDGERFAVVAGRELRVHLSDDPGTQDTAVDIPVESRFQGWVDDGAALISTTDRETGLWTLERVDLATGDRSPVTEQAAVSGTPGMADVSLATGLLSELETREPGDSDHGGLLTRVGTWPFVVGAVVLLLALALVWWWRTAQSRRQELAPSRISRLEGLDR